ncbi:Beta-glucan synthesis-associated protein [Mycena kentingensis (nom. inval.)]|nr:Beta-glucan synthesis-associated protein [Mycena kentingensis (nom. inval.)]
MTSYPRRGYRPEGSPSLLSNYTDSPSSPLSPSRSGLSEKYSLAADPFVWGSDLSPQTPEPDDALHNPTYRNGKVVENNGSFWSGRAFANLGCLAVLCIAVISLFVAYPVTSFIERATRNKGINNAIVNATGQARRNHSPSTRLNLAQVASMGNFGLIDLDTPESAYTIKSKYTGKEMKLVFSDEFNVDGRSFYPGDDPYWEAMDLHYWATNNMEWYDPSSVTTQNGSLVITLSEVETHNLPWKGGMLSTWNKFCFTGGLLVGAANMPGTNNIHGLWPAFWAMGNLGRAGYGATLDGMWPYTYDSCDVGTLPNQTLNGLPTAATTSGAENAPINGELSYLVGQRLSRCTCPGESHPGPIHSDGTYVGRAAPEIDVFEAQISNNAGQQSQSAQWAPFNNGYVWFNTSENLIIYDESVSFLNTYIGGVYQQATSVVTDTDQNCYELVDPHCRSVYGFEYKPGYSQGYISWINDNKLSWTLLGDGFAADPLVEIGPRPIPQEPLYILLNLGMSRNFGTVDLDHLTFPTRMRVDYVRVYQYPDQINVGCDPPDYPTAAYINTYQEAYTNPNLTTWVDDYKQPMPKNRFAGEC